MIDLFSMYCGPFQSDGLGGHCEVNVHVRMAQVVLSLRSRQEDPMKGPSRFNLCFNPTKQVTRGGLQKTEWKLKLSLSYDIGIQCFWKVFRNCCSPMKKNTSVKTPNPIITKKKKLWKLSKILKKKKLKYHNDISIQTLNLVLGWISFGWVFSGVKSQALRT